MMARWITIQEAPSVENVVRFGERSSVKVASEFGTCNVLSADPGCAQVTKLPWPWHPP